MRHSIIFHNWDQGRIKGGGQLPRTPAARAPRDEIYLFNRYKNTTLYYIPMLR